VYWNTDLADWTDFRGRWAVGTRVEQIEQIFADLGSKNTTIWAKIRILELINESEADSFCIFLVLLWAWFVFLMGKYRWASDAEGCPKGSTYIVAITSEAKYSYYIGMSV
jgi:hypothetical protein